MDSASRKNPIGGLETKFFKVKSGWMVNVLYLTFDENTVSNMCRCTIVFQVSRSSIGQFILMALSGLKGGRFYAKNSVKIAR